MNSREGCLMDNKNGNLVMFPKWKTALERVGMEALKDKRYEEAAEAFEPLAEYGVASHDINTGLLMSWIELGKFDDAESLCHQLMKEEHDQYYHYLHIYITVLFQSSRYQEIVDLLDEVFEAEDIPHQSRTQLWQMYEVSGKLLEDQQKEIGSSLMEDFRSAMENEDIHKQWQVMEQMKNQPSAPYIEEVEPVLQNESVHPVIKSAVIEWFRDEEVDKEMTVVKFGQEMKIVPAELTQLHSDYIIKQIQMRLGQVEQNNPSMYEMINKLLFHYCYVRYPFFPDEEEVVLLVEALKQLGHEYLQLPYEPQYSSEDVAKYKEEVEICEQHYMMIAGE